VRKSVARSKGRGWIGPSEANKELAQTVVQIPRMRAMRGKVKSLAQSREVRMPALGQQRPFVPFNRVSALRQ
jgi:hypothetical protein